jgi:hypothetical protein
MARILFPNGYFPLNNCVKSSEDQAFGPETFHNSEATIKQIMEVYWRVKKWRLENAFLGTSVEIYNWADQDLPPETEEKLVCGALSEFAPGDSFIGCSISSDSIGSFGTILNGFLNVVGFVPAIYDELPGGIKKYYMGLYIELAWSTEDPYQPYSGLSYNPFLSLTGSFTIPIILSDSTINITMFYDPDEYLPASGVTIRAIEWWPYEDDLGNPLYDSTTGLPI